LRSGDGEDQGGVRPLPPELLLERRDEHAPGYTAYLLKEELRALYRCGARAAKRHLQAWLVWASRSRLAPFVKLARTLRRHRDGILAAIVLGMSNGRMEGINNKIGVIKHRVYGFHSAAALIAMVFLCCSGIQVTLPI
jgi:transposase